MRAHDHDLCREEHGDPGVPDDMHTHRIAEKLQRVYHLSPVHQKMLDYLARRSKGRRTTTIDTFQHVTGAKRVLVTQAARDIAATGVGVYRKGVHGRPSRIDWHMSLMEVGRLATSKTEVTSETRPAPTTAAACRDRLFRALLQGEPIARNLLVALDTQERLVAPQRGLHVIDRQFLRRCIDPSSPHRALLGDAVVGAVLADHESFCNLSPAEVIEWLTEVPTLVDEMIASAPNRTVRILADKLREHIYDQAVAGALVDAL